jgi:hypothetical protein
LAGARHPHRQIVSPDMANRLPEDEAEPLRFEFAREMEPLRRAA